MRTNASPLHRAMVVSLRGASQRRQQFHARHPWLDYDFFDAIEPATQACKPRSLIQPHIGKPDFSLGALGCLLSHRRIWKQFLETTSQWLPVFEDDVAVRRGRYQRLCAAVIAKPLLPHVILLGASDGLAIPDFRRIIGASWRWGILTEPHARNLYCAYGYLVSREGARRLLDATCLGVPVDYWAAHASKVPLRYGLVTPEIAVPSPDAQWSSTAGKVKSLPRRGHTLQAVANGLWHAMRKA